MESIYLTARETAERLGIKRDTLYAYVSRGLLRSVAVPGSRERGYRAEDVERLRAGRGLSRATRSDSRAIWRWRWILMYGTRRPPKPRPQRSRESGNCSRKWMSRTA